MIFGADVCEPDIFISTTTRIAKDTVGRVETAICSAATIFLQFFQSIICFAVGGLDGCAWASEQT